MKKYKVKANVTMEIVTLIEADDEKQAESLAYDRLSNGDISICIHGSEFTDGLNEEQFTLTDGDVSDIGNVMVSAD